jgi:uncharacterized protein YjbJ (UPF0337 family)
MDFNTRISSNWNELKGSIRQKWGKLSDDDTQVWKGNFEELSGKIQRAYGVTKEHVEQEFNSLLSRFSDKADHKAEGLKQSVDTYSDKQELKTEESKLDESNKKLA